MYLPRKGYFKDEIHQKRSPIIVHSLHPNQTAIVEFMNGTIRLVSFSEIQLAPYVEEELPFSS